MNRAFVEALSLVCLTGLHFFLLPVAANAQLAALQPVKEVSVPRRSVVRPTNLSVSSGTPLVIDFGSSSILDLTGNLSVARGATIYAISTNPAIQTATIRASNIINRGLITTNVPSGALSAYPNALAGLNLSLIAIRNFVNSGVVSSAGDLNIVAGTSVSNTGGAAVLQATNNLSILSPSLVNQGTVSSIAGNLSFNNYSQVNATLLNLMNSPTLSALLSSTGAGFSVTNLTNSGKISALGNIEISALAGCDLSINNKFGLINSITGNLALQSPYSHDLELEGGHLQASQLLATAVGGTVAMNAERIDGDVHITAAIAGVISNSGDLNIASLQLSDDPIFALRGGGTLSIDGFSPGVASDFVALSEGNVVLSGTIDTKGGAITVSAGHFFVGENGNPCTSCKGQFSILGTSGFSGIIHLKGTQLISGGNSVSLGSPALYLTYPGLPGQPSTTPMIQAGSGSVSINCDSISFNSVPLDVYGGKISIQTNSKLVLGIGYPMVHAAAVDGGSVFISAAEIKAYENGVSAPNGGSISLVAKSVDVSSIDVSGAAKGGSIYIDCDLFGPFSFPAKPVVLSANGIGTGPGGSITIKALGNLVFGPDFKLSATGGSPGSNSGDGGSITLTSINEIQIGADAINVSSLGLNGTGGKVSLNASSSGDILLTGNILAKGPTDGGTVIISAGSLSNPTGDSAVIDVSGISRYGGKISINTWASGDLVLGAGAGTISTIANGDSKGGNITLSPKVGAVNVYSAGILVNGLGATGSGGNVSISGTTVNIMGNGVNASGRGGGSVSLSGQDIYLKNESINTSTKGLTQVGSEITITATGSLDLEGTLHVDGSVVGGMIDINSNTISSHDNATLSASGTGTGHGGKISIVTPSNLALGDSDQELKLVASGGSANSASGNGGEVNVVATQGISVKEMGIDMAPRGNQGNGGSVSLTTSGNLALGTTLNASADSDGKGGAIALSAKTITFLPETITSLKANGGGAGSGGTISVLPTGTAQPALVLDNSPGNFVMSATGGSTGSSSGNGGSITVSTKSSIEVNAESLSVEAKGLSGNGGKISLNAGTSINLHSFLLADGASTSGDGGDIVLSAKTTFAADNGAIVSAMGNGNGKGGNITATFHSAEISGPESTGLRMRADASGTGAGGSINLSTSDITGAPSTGGDLILGQAAGEISLSVKLGDTASAGGVINVLAQNNLTVNPGAIELEGRGSDGSWSGRLLLFSSYNSAGPSTFPGTLTVNDSIEVFNRDGSHGNVGQIYLDAGGMARSTLPFDITLNGNLQAGTVSIVNWGNSSSVTHLSDGNFLSGVTVGLATPSLLVAGSESPLVEIKGSNIAVAVFNPGAAGKLTISNLPSSTSFGVISLFLPEGFVQGESNSVLTGSKISIGSTGTSFVPTTDPTRSAWVQTPFQITGAGDIGTIDHPILVSTPDLSIFSGGSVYVKSSGSAKLAGTATGQFHYHQDSASFLTASQVSAPAILFDSPGGLDLNLSTDYLSINSKGSVSVLVGSYSADQVEIGNITVGDLFMSTGPALISGTITGTRLQLNSGSVPLTVNGNIVASSGYLGPEIYDASVLLIGTPLQLNGEIKSKTINVISLGEEVILSGNFVATKSMSISGRVATQSSSSTIISPELKFFNGSFQILGQNQISVLSGEGVSSVSLNNLVPMEIQGFVGFLGSDISGPFVYTGPELIFKAPLNISGAAQFQSNTPDQTFRFTVRSAGSLSAAGGIIFNANSSGPVIISTSESGILSFGTPSSISFLSDSAAGLSHLSTSESLSLSPVNGGLRLVTNGSMEFGGRALFGTNTNLQALPGTVAVGFASNVHVQGDLSVSCKSLVNPDGFTATGNIVFNIVGGKTIVNPYGDINLTSNMLINTQGRDLAIIASGNVTGSNLSTINLSSTTGSGGQLNVFAGVNFLQDSLDDFTITGASASGGDINLAKTSINTSSTSSAFDAGSGGNITLVASAGNLRLGVISVSSINSSSLHGTGGSVQLVGAGGILLNGSIQSQGKLAGGNVVLSGSNFVAGTELRSAHIASPSSIALAPIKGSGAAVLVFGKIDSSSKLGNGGDINVYSEARMQIAGITTTGAGSSGSVLLSAINGAIVAGEINTAGMNSVVSDAGHGGNVSITAPSSVRVDGSIITRGGIVTRDPDPLLVGGNAGNISISTESNGGSFAGKISIKGYLDLSGGYNNTSKQVAGGSAGDLSANAATFQVLGAKSTSQGATSILASGGKGSGPVSAGNVSISTFSVQDLPSNLNLSSMQFSEIALPGGIFNVGNASINGTKGIILAGSSIVKANSVVAGVMAGNISDSNFMLGTVSINAHGGDAYLNVGGVTNAFHVASSSRTKVTPAQALALYQVSRGQLQTVGLNFSGQAFDINPTNPAESSRITVPSADLPEAFSAFKLGIPNSKTGLELNIEGNYPVLTLTGAASSTIDGMVHFNTNGHSAIIVAGSNFKVAKGASVTADNQLVLASSKTKGSILVSNDGTMAASKLVLLTPAASFKLNNNESGSLNLGSIMVPDLGAASTVSLISKGTFATGLLEFSPLSMPAAAGISVSETLIGSSLPKSMNITLSVLGGASLGGELKSSGAISITANSVLLFPVALGIMPGATIEAALPLSMTATGPITVGSNASVVSTSGSTLLAGNGINLESASLISGYSAVTIHGKNGIINFNDNSVSAAKGMLLVDTTTIANINGNLTAGTINGNPTFEPISTKLTPSSISINASSVNLGTDSNTNVIATGGNVAMTAKSGNLTLGSASTANFIQSLGGNVILLASGQITGGPGNEFKACSQGGSISSGGGIELGAGTTTSRLAAARLSAAGTVSGPFATNFVVNNPNDGDNKSGVVQANFSNGAAGTNSINVSSSGLNQAVLNLQGGAIVFDARGISNTVKLDGATFTVAGLKPISYSASVSQINLIDFSEFKNTGQAKLASILVPGRKGIQILSAQGRVANDLACIDFQAGDLMISPTVKTIIHTPLADIHVKKGALLSLSCGKSGVRIIDCGNSGEIRVVAPSGKSIWLEPGEELTLAKPPLQNDEMLVEDGIGRRRFRQVDLGRDVYSGLCDVSLISLLGNLEHLNALRHPRNELEARFRSQLMKTASAVEIVTKSRGAYQARQRRNTQRVACDSAS